MDHDLTWHDETGFVCNVCRGIKDVDMPTDCPGRPISLEEGDLMREGRLNYVRGCWIDPLVNTYADLERRIQQNARNN